MCDSNSGVCFARLSHIDGSLPKYEMVALENATVFDRSDGGNWAMQSPIYETCGASGCLALEQAHGCVAPGVLGFGEEYDGQCAWRTPADAKAGCAGWDMCLSFSCLAEAGGACLARDGSGAIKALAGWEHHATSWEAVGDLDSLSGMALVTDTVVGRGWSPLPLLLPLP